MKSVLLHSCCAPCSVAIIEWLLGRHVHTAVYFYNPNIYPETEYEKRKAEIVRYSEIHGVEVINGDYDYGFWEGHVVGLEDEPERGLRCLECFKMRMLATAKLAEQRGFQWFATSLASSPQKNLQQIAQAGHWAAAQFENVKFLEKNWRKDGLNERKIQILKENDFYKQNYCGCRNIGRKT